MRLALVALVLACTSCSRVLAPPPPDAGPVAFASPPPSTSVAPAPPPCRPPRSVDAMMAPIHADAGGLGLARDYLTPLLPGAWPKARDGGVVVFAYRTKLPPTSRITRRNEAPHQRIVFASLDANAVAEPLPPSKWSTLREERYRDGKKGPTIASAEEALLAIVAGCRDAEQARADLAPYLEWDAEEGLSEALDPPQKAFFAWLRKKNE